MSEKITILMINMAKGFGGGEFQTERLISELSAKYNISFLGKKESIFVKKIRQNMPQIQVLTLLEAIKLVICKKNIIIHAQDGRAVHIASFLKRISRNNIMVITRHVSFPFKRKISLFSYKNADYLIGVSKQVTNNLQCLNKHYKTIYGCIPSLQENIEFEMQYFSNKNSFSVAQIGNLQLIKNISLTINLAVLFPHINFYIVGSGPLEQELKQQAKDLNNVIFIPFTPYVGSVLKHIDLHIMPSHSEGLGSVILEAYQYKVPTIAHATGGIPEIIENGETGYLIQENNVEEYQKVLQSLVASPDKLLELQKNITHYVANNDFSARRMAMEYRSIYQELLEKD
ncbi:MAG: glycosyl transferase [Pasteurellales bacterium]|nr:MAG: glycosyl transferase [Pasteurellales bacterium]